MSQNCAFRDLKCETQHMRYLIAVRHTYSFQDICYQEEHGQRKGTMLEKRSLCRRQNTPTPLGRLANLLDTKFVWENGEALMQCRDKGHAKR